MTSGKLFSNTNKMKPTKILIISAVIGLVLITVFSLVSSQSEAADSKTDDLNYVERIDSLRKVQNDFMAKNENSPFIIQEASFASLSYFAVDENYKVSAVVEPIVMGKIHALQTSNDKIKKYKEVALLHFDIVGKHGDLTLLQSEDKAHYFLPFYDETSAITTYGAGRYLEVVYTGDESDITLDFNNAYNPYCAYVDGYSCPVPPAKNQLKIAIEAGEKIYTH
ncbi:MAG: hypothetical protein ACJAT1_000488 [Marivirga sp.]|jgi:uncharacterized protein (DUF1684 family)